jgi:hypothetical protein
MGQPSAQNHIAHSQKKKEVPPLELKQSDYNLFKLMKKLGMSTRWNTENVIKVLEHQGYHGNGVKEVKRAIEAGRREMKEQRQLRALNQ